jgi:hypothetical protein
MIKGVLTSIKGDVYLMQDLSSRFGLFEGLRPLLPVCPIAVLSSSPLPRSAGFSIMSNSEQTAICLLGRLARLYALKCSCRPTVGRSRSSHCSKLKNREKHRINPG